MDIRNDQHSNNVEDTPRLRTFQSDIADAIKNQKGSVVKIAVREQERKQQEGVIHQTQNRKNVVFIFLGLILLGIAGGIFGYIHWQEKKKQQAIVDQLPTKRSFISGDHITQVAIPDTTVLKDVLEKNMTDLDIPVGQIEHMLLLYTDEDKNQTIVPLEDLFSSFSIAPPDGFYYSLAEDTYMYGIYQTTEGERFILLKTKVFSNTFSQLLVWEKTFAADFKNLLGVQIGEGEKVTFKDKIIRNEDVRIGSIGDREVIAYTFFGSKKEFLLITAKADTLSSLLGRFSKKLLEQ